MPDPAALDVVCYERLRPAQMVARRDACPVAYLPCGILEWHGRHNPLGLDGVKAHALCVHLAQALGGTVWPTLWYGDNRDDILENVFTDANFAVLSHDHRPEVARALDVPFDNLLDQAARSRNAGGWRLWRELLAHTVSQIEAYGFGPVVVLCGHYPLIGPARDLADDLGDRPDGRRRVYAFTEADPIAAQGFHGDHAARWETSVMLALEPALVDLTALADEPDEVLGVLGEDPRGATAAYGEAGIQALVAAVGELLGLPRA